MTHVVQWDHLRGKAVIYSFFEIKKRCFFGFTQHINQQIVFDELFKKKVLWKKITKSFFYLLNLTFLLYFIHLCDDLQKKFDALCIKTTLNPARFWNLFRTFGFIVYTDIIHFFYLIERCNNVIRQTL